MMSDRRPRKSAAGCTLWILGTLVLITAPRGACGQTSTTQLTVSNAFTTPNVTYATVTLTQTPGQVVFSVTANPKVPVYTSVDPTKFGITQFGFNTNNITLVAGNIVFDTPGWQVKRQNASDPHFGTFDWILQANTLATFAAQTLSFHVQNPSVTISTFTTKTTSPQRALFVAHIKGFTSGSVTDHSVADGGATPLAVVKEHLPITFAIAILILLAAVIACIVLRYKRSNVRSKPEMRL
jgi:hypothetical protein